MVGVTHKTPNFIPEVGSGFQAPIARILSDPHTLQCKILEILVSRRTVRVSYRYSRYKRRGGKKRNKMEIRLKEKSGEMKRKMKRIKREPNKERRTGSNALVDMHA